AQHTVVANLTTRLGVERCCIEDHNGLLPRSDRLYGGAIDIEGRYLAFSLQGFIAPEIGMAAIVGETFSHLEFACGPRLLALTLHGGVETLLIDTDTAFTADVGSEVNRKTVSVIEREQRLTVEHAIGRNTRQRRLKNLHAMFKGFDEALFFLAQHLLHASLLLGQFRICLAHFLDQIRHQTVEERLLLPQFVAVPQCAPHDTTQDVTPAFVAGNDAIDNEEAASTDVVGYDLERIVFQIPATSFTRCGGNEVAEEVDFVIGMLVLQNRGNTLQTHAGVNAGLWQ